MFFLESPGAYQFEVIVQQLHVLSEEIIVTTFHQGEKS